MSFITSPGVIGFANLQSTLAPNNIVPVSYFLGSGLPANVDVAFGPKGTGSILAQIPDNTAAGGNKRGSNSVDLQMSRSAATQVVTANFSGIMSGQFNTVQNSRSFIGSGLSNLIDGAGTDSFIGGGNGNHVGSTFGSIAGGASNLVTGIGSAIPGGQSASDRGLPGAFVMSASNNVGVGRRQWEAHSQGIVTTDAVPTQLLSDSGNALSTISIADNSAMAFDTLVCGQISTGGDSAGFRIQGFVRRGAGAGTTTFPAVVTVTPLGATVGAVAWLATVIADVVNGGIAVQVTGQAATLIRWSAITSCAYSQAN